MSSPGRKLELACPAKLNLSLAVGPATPTPRGTLHPVGSWMATLAFGDRLLLSRPITDPDREAGRGQDFDNFSSPLTSDGSPPEPWHGSTDEKLTDPSTLKLSRRLANDAPRRYAIDWPAESDLAARAHRLVEQAVGRPLPTSATLVKSVPPGAGLGGGSANAAAMIVGLDHLYRLGLSDSARHDLATQLGSDVVFALATLPPPAPPLRPTAPPLGTTGAELPPDSAPVSAWVDGFGERVRPLPPVAQKSASSPTTPGTEIVLVLPDFGCPTPAVYRAFDQLPVPPRPKGEAQDAAEHFRRRCTAYEAAADRGDLPDAAYANDLEPAAVTVQPRLGLLLRQLRGDLGLAVHLTGSGAACFVICREPGQASDTAQRINEFTDAAVIVTHLR